MPLIRRLPKRGFSNVQHATTYIPVNVGALDAFEDGATVDWASLKKAGLANGNADGVKILGSGELSKKLTVKVQAFSASAKAKIEGAGGSCEVTAVSKSKKSEDAA